MHVNTVTDVGDASGILFNKGACATLFTYICPIFSIIMDLV